MKKKKKISIRGFTMPLRHALSLLAGFVLAMIFCISIIVAEPIFGTEFWDATFRIVSLFLPLIYALVMTCFVKEEQTTDLVVDTMLYWAGGLIGTICAVILLLVI
ncbi:hypothetical protein GF367_01260, partial [Candidatus Woesearchaeota archaeon]|nr:hypothetical protein [Candidatus Woesearchaeota archaeon]